ncbi:hypothetical protein AB0M87_04380 [Streptomyces sp. NPDC051320]|uniref:hypothetical protein n=1 Tax=Streptomyces sp. NPDC051320 TaxID=3154644 RepID=UPI003436CB86
MAQDSWPSPNHNTRNVTDGEYEKIAARFSDDGVWGDPTDAAVVSAGTGLQVSVRSGVYASLRGHAWYSGTVAFTLPVASNVSGLVRVDWVVLRLDRSTWDVTAEVREGTPGAGTPALARDTGDTGLYEIPLGFVHVNSGASSVTVTPFAQYIGSRIRPCTSTTRPVALRGEMAYETDTGHWIGWNGSKWIILYQDTGELSLGAGFDTWTNSGDAVGQRVGDVVSLRISKQRVGSTFNATDADGSKLATVPAVLLNTVRNQYFPCQFSNGKSGRVEVLTNGEMWVRMLSGDVGVGQTLSLTMTYLV